MRAWRLFTTYGADPAFNMGLDEALLEEPLTPPTLRLYTWEPDTLPLGYFQRCADVPGIERAGAVVRRITGGGAIHHVDELTFSIATSLDDPLYRGSIGESYVRVHAAIAVALGQFGVVAEPRGERALRSDLEGTGMCFHDSTDLDLVWNERKGVGSAQRRKHGRVLHHGSIKLGTSELEGDIAFARTVAPDLDVPTFAEALLGSFRRAFEIEFERGVPDAEERARARDLGRRYVDPEFVRKR